MIKLSFSAINNCLQPHNSHNWLNRVAEIEPEDHGYYHEGKEAHDVIQKHVSDAELHLDLLHITKKFEIVEKIEKDPECKFSFLFRGKEYKIRGYYDGRDKDTTELLEIKTSSAPWSLGKFQKSIQRKLYVLSNQKIKTCYLITGKRKPAEWKETPPKLFKVPATLQDRQDAIDWLNAGINILESGEFTGGLTEDGRCNLPRCYFGCNCSFRNI